MSSLDFPQPNLYKDANPLETLSKTNSNQMVFQFKPTAETHDLKGKIVLVTGGSAGVGKESCKVFARLGKSLF